MRVRFIDNNNIETTKECTSVLFRDRGLCLIVNSREGRTTPVNVCQLLEIKEGNNNEST